MSVQRQAPLVSEEAYHAAAARLWQRLNHRYTDKLDPLLESLDAEQAVLLLHAAARPHAALLHRSRQQPPWLLFTLINPLIHFLRYVRSPLVVVLCFLVMAALLTTFEVLRRRRFCPARVRLDFHLARLLPYCTTTAVLPALLDLALWSNSAPQDPLLKTIARVLMKAGTGEIWMSVRDEHRVLLRRWCVDKAMPADVVKAALLTLATLGDRESIPQMQALAAQRAEVRDGVLVYLDSLRS